MSTNQQHQDTYAYTFGDHLYINLTNRCTSDCNFCVRKNRSGIADDSLWIEKEPSALDVIAQIEQMGDLSKFAQIVFCGYGEPTLRLDVLKEVAKYAKAHGKTTRLDTNGHGNLYHDRDITEELEGLIDIVSISLNAANAESYQEICHTIYGEKGFDAMLDFAAQAKLHIPTVLFTVVDTIGEEEIEKSKALVETIGIPLRVRTYIQ